MFEDAESTVLVALCAQHIPQSICVHMLVTHRACGIGGTRRVQQGLLQPMHSVSYSECSRLTPSCS